MEKELKNELWKDIEGYEGYYQVSSLGRVKSLDRIDATGRKLKGRILKPTLTIPSKKYKDGYFTVALSIGGKIKRHKVHRLVAKAFIPNPNNFPEVNHKDENKINNNINNLEWCNKIYNCNYGTRNERANKTKEQKHSDNKKIIKINNSNKTNKKKPILAIKKDKCSFIYFESISQAGNVLNICKKSISNYCKRDNISFKGYYFYYI